MEMLVDPVLVRWVPRWVAEQYERWNPKFRVKLDQVLQRGKIVKERGLPVKLPTGDYKRVPVTSNAELLRTVREYMVKSAARQAQAAKAKQRGLLPEKDSDEQKSDSDASQRPGSGADTDDDDGPDDDPNAAVADGEGERGKIGDKRPQVPGVADGAAGGTVAEQLSGAGYAPAVGDRTVRVSASGVPAYVGQVNPPPGSLWFHLNWFLI